MRAFDDGARFVVLCMLVSSGVKFATPTQNGDA
jgi:hypothetical protein